MQPVPCWEKVWGPPDGAPPGTTFRVFKWVKTDKKQVRLPNFLRLWRIYPRPNFATAI